MEYNVIQILNAGQGECTGLPPPPRDLLGLISIAIPSLLGSHRMSVPAKRSSKKVKLLSIGQNPKKATILDKTRVDCRRSAFIGGICSNYLKP